MFLRMPRIIVRVKEKLVYGAKEPRQRRFQRPWKKRFDLTNGNGQRHAFCGKTSGLSYVQNHLSFAHEYENFASVEVRKSRIKFLFWFKELLSRRNE